MQIGSIVLARGAMKPYIVKQKTSQTVVETENGEITVTEKAHNKVRFIHVKAKEDRDIAERIANFLANGARFRAVPFSLIDDDGSTWTVRFWDDEVRTKQRGATLVELDLLFRVEVNQGL